MSTLPSSTDQDSPTYLNHHPQLSFRTGRPLPTNTYDPAQLEEGDGDIPGFGSKAALDAYTAGKGRKSVVPQATYDLIIHTLLHPADPSPAVNPQLRYAFKHDPKYTLLHLPPDLSPNPNPASAPPSRTSTVLLHAGRPVAVREQLYAVLAACHAEAGHGGRDKTGEVVRMYFSKVTKDVVQEFVRGCGVCGDRDRGRGVVRRGGGGVGEGVAPGLGVGKGFGRLERGVDARLHVHSGLPLQYMSEVGYDATRDASTFDAGSLAEPLGTWLDATPAAGDSTPPFDISLTQPAPGPSGPEQVGSGRQAPSGTVTQDAFGVSQVGPSFDTLDFVEGLTRSVRTLVLEDDHPAFVLDQWSTRQSPFSEFATKNGQPFASVGLTAAPSLVVPDEHGPSLLPLSEHVAPSTVAFDPMQPAHPITGGLTEWGAIDADQNKTWEPTQPMHTVEGTEAGGMRSELAANPTWLDEAVASTLRGRRQAGLPPLRLAAAEPASASDTPWQWHDTVGYAEPLARQTRSDEPATLASSGLPVLRHRHSTSALADFAERGWEYQPHKDGFVAQMIGVEDHGGWLWGAGQSSAVGEGGPLSAVSMVTGLTTGVSAGSLESPLTPVSAYPINLYEAYPTEDPWQGQATLSCAPTTVPGLPTDKLAAGANECDVAANSRRAADLAFLDHLRTLPTAEGLAALADYTSNLARTTVPPAALTGAPSGPPSPSSFNLPWTFPSSHPADSPFTFPPPSLTSFHPRSSHRHSRTHSLSATPLAPHSLTTYHTRHEQDPLSYGSQCDAAALLEWDGEGVSLERRGSATEGQYAKDVAAARGLRPGPAGLRRVASAAVGLRGRFAPY